MKTVEEALKEIDHPEDSEITKAFSVIGLAMKVHQPLYSALMNDFMIAMSNANNTIGTFEGPLTTGRYAAKDFLDNWIKKAEKL